MKVPQKIEADGLRAYERVCAFEQLRRRRLPVIYCLFPLLFVVCGFGSLMGNRPELAVVCLVTAILFSVVAWLNWRRLSQRYAKNLEILAELESTYGDELPWIKVENHFAALEQLKRNLEEERKKDDGVEL